MTKRNLLCALVVLGVGALAAQFASAFEPRQPINRVPWHNEYYDPAWGEPLALVVPPTANTQTQYGWGVGGTRTTPIPVQFSRYYPGYGGSYGRFYPTPYWPSDTNQFGVYYIRGPW
jgi:hypothetical protein